MDEHTACEQAYKNGYEAGKKEATEMWQKEIALLARESVKRDLALAKLELEIEAAIEARPIVRGKNITQMNPVDEFICSVCNFRCEDIHQMEYDEDGEDFSCCEYEFKYCPECGVEMEGETE